PLLDEDVELLDVGQQLFDLLFVLGCHSGIRLEKGNTGSLQVILAQCCPKSGREREQILERGENRARAGVGGRGGLCYNGLGIIS
ncbi:MAG TPA: hypothetical protein V6C82_09550, partial [Chroococcales cyanobacterium]